MRKIYLLLLLSVSFSKLFPQLNDSRVTIDTSYRPAIYFETDLSEDEATGAIESYFDSLNIEKEKGKGFIIKKSLGYMLFRKAKVDYMDNIIDCYFVTNSRELKSGDAASVYLAVSKNGSFLSPDDKEDWNKLKGYAGYLQQNYFQQYVLNNKITDVQKEMDKKNKKLADINKQKLDLETGVSKDSALLSTMHGQLLELKSKKN